MDKLNLSLGLKSYQLQEGCPPLMFRPDDPNVYARFVEAVDELEQLGEKYTSEAAALDASEKDTENAKALLLMMKNYDLVAKQVLNNAFGAQNDFDKILGGVSLFNETGGKANIEIVMEALMPLFEEGIHKYTSTLADIEVAQAATNREQRRALEHGNR